MDAAKEIKRALFASENNKFKFLLKRKILELSANSLSLSSGMTLMISISFTNTRKSRGPSIDPCGTPCSSLHILI